MKNLFFKAILLCLCMLASINTFAYDAKIDGIYYNFISENEAEVTYLYYNLSSNSSAYSGSVVIPASVTYKGKTYSVTSIGAYAFCYCNDLTSATIPNSVTSIDYRAFDGCRSLASITIPNGVASIAGYAFSGCRLTSIIIPNSVKSIGDNAFRNCGSLKSVSIPNSVTTIGCDAFYGTSWFNNKPNGLVYAGKVAYKYKGTMPEEMMITIEDGTLGIADKAFYNCSSLTSINIPNSVTSIGNNAFYNCI